LFLGNNAASINLKNARFSTKFIFENCAFYVLDMEPEPESQPEPEPEPEPKSEPEPEPEPGPEL
jgi:hypothetical protein